MVQWMRTIAMTAFPAVALVGLAAVAPAAGTVEFRSFDGSGNNLSNPEQGVAGAPFLRVVDADYGDGAGTPAGADRPSARLISNVVSTERQPEEAAVPVSDLLWQWGQFIDHDMVLTPAAAPTESFDIPVPAFDGFFDPSGEGDVVLPFRRSAAAAGPTREQVNLDSPYLDASMVYGSDDARAAALRRLDGSGRMATSGRRRLPRNTAGLANDPSPALTGFFVAGDVRANEQTGLLALHTIFVLEHNRLSRRSGLLAKTLKALGGDSSTELSGELRYQLARVLVGAEIQAITYRAFLPMLLGDDALGDYQDYRPEVDATVSNIFAAGAFRLGHTLLPQYLERRRRSGQVIRAGDLPLRDAFFDPSRLDEGGPGAILRGMANHRSQELDLQVVEDVRSFLFGAPGAGGSDLAALNIQRGRDHGLPSYNDVRRGFGLTPAADFAAVTSDTDLAGRLLGLYGDVEKVDFWVGALAEDHKPGMMVGELLAAVLGDQFSRTRDGDRFWYENILSGRALRFVKKRTLANILRAHTSIGDEIGQEAFRVDE
jgi:peroxidase